MKTENVVWCQVSGCMNKATHTNFITYHDGYGIIKYYPCCKEHRLDWHLTLSEYQCGRRPQGSLKGVFTNRRNVTTEWNKLRDKFAEDGLLKWRHGC